MFLFFWSELFSCNLCMVFRWLLRHCSHTNSERFIFLLSYQLMTVFQNSSVFYGVWTPGSSRTILRKAVVFLKTIRASVIGNNLWCACNCVCSVHCKVRLKVGRRLGLCRLTLVQPLIELSTNKFSVRSALPRYLSFSIV